MVVMNNKIKNIPGYLIDDSINNRRVALLQLEQFMDEQTITKEIIEDLIKIILIARRKNEKRIYTLAGLIMKQGLKYIQKDGMIPVSVPLEDIDLLEFLKTSAKKLDDSGQHPSKKFFERLSEIKKENTHFMVKAYIHSLLNSYNERGDFSGAFAFKKKGSSIPY